MPYRVRKTWGDAKTQLGQFTNFEDARDMVDRHREYNVFDEYGRRMYPVEPNGYQKLVYVSDGNHPVRTGPNSTRVKRLDRVGAGFHTIVDIQNGWGLLKPFEENRDGWIWLGPHVVFV